MNRRLRRMHRGMFLFLALALPVIVALALQVRHWPPRAVELPGFLEREPGIVRDGQP